MKFKTLEIYSAVVGRLLCDMGKVHEVLDFLTGDQNFTHQLPRVMKECQPHVFKQFPQMETFDISGCDSSNWKSYADQIVAIFGEELEIQPIPRDSHAFKNPITEAQEMMGGKPVIVVGPTTDDV